MVEPASVFVIVTSPDAPAVGAGRPVGRAPSDEDAAAEVEAGPELAEPTPTVASALAETAAVARLGSVVAGAVGEETGPVDAEGSPAEGAVHPTTAAARQSAIASVCRIGADVDMA
jgi:hypothetical protein